MDLRVEYLLTQRINQIIILNLNELLKYLNYLNNIDLYNYFL
jgi:hypothetical protein